jgi:hypothetical protein
MSRTYKDRPYPVQFRFLSSFYEESTSKTLKRKEVDTEFHWMSTPSWWTHTFMIKPRRVQENQALRIIPSDLEEFDFVDIKRKNHKYYW